MFLILINFGNQYLGIFDQWLGNLISYLLLELRNNDIDDQLLLLFLAQCLILHFVVHFPGVPRLQYIAFSSLIVAQLTLQTVELTLRIVLRHVVVIILNQVLQLLLGVSALSLRHLQMVV